MAKNYIPSNDQDLRAWMETFIPNLNANLATLGLVPDDLTPLEDAQSGFDTSLDQLAANRVMYEGSVSLKKTKRTALEGALRPLVRRIQNHPGMTDQLRGLLGLPVYDHTASTSGIGVEVPGIALETSVGMVTVHFGTDPSNEQINGKPHWAKGCNIYRRREGESDFRLLAFSTRSPFTDTVAGPAADYTYQVRYRGTKVEDIGQASPPMTVAAGGELAQAA